MIIVLAFTFETALLGKLMSIYSTELSKCSPMHMAAIRQQLSANSRTIEGDFRFGSWLVVVLPDFGTLIVDKSNYNSHELSTRDLLVASSMSFYLNSAKTATLGGLRGFA
ncbi:hypothetical protein GB937_002833 [Aspergillus fischeri]|nr:hypothetical protein GB937_002833 [Aspergillus fischeri]